MKKGMKLWFVHIDFGSASGKVDITPFAVEVSVLVLGEFKQVYLGPNGHGGMLAIYEVPDAFDMETAKRKLAAAQKEPREEDSQQ